MPEIAPDAASYPSISPVFLQFICLSHTSLVALVAHLPYDKTSIKGAAMITHRTAPAENTSLPCLAVSREKIEGIFLGTAIGDALGLPVETYDRKTIADGFGQIRSFLSPGAHKWYGGMPAGTVSDDTQLTLALAEALIASTEIDMQKIADSLVAAYKESTLGWGGSTKEAVQRLIDGVHWSKSGQTGDPNRGAGNGVPMRIAPLSVFAQKMQWNDEKLAEIVREISDMTHGTKVSAAAGLAQARAVAYCLKVAPDEFSRDDFLSELISACRSVDPLDEDPATSALKQRFQLLACTESMSDHEIIGAFGGGSCYVLDSLPFTYAFFLRNPGSIESLYEAVSAGGDTDSNGAMLGALLGALHGREIFPQELREGLVEKEKIGAAMAAFADHIVAQGTLQ